MLTFLAYREMSKQDWPDEKEIIKRIDYIFSKGFQTISHQHVDKKLDNENHISDHLPVFVKVKIMR